MTGSWLSRGLLLAALGSMAVAEEPLPLSPSGKYLAPVVGQGRPVDLGLVQVASGIFRIGGLVTVNCAARTIHIPARVAMTRQMVEYVLVSTYGKRHEAILVTDATPEQMHAGRLLLATESPTHDQPVTIDLLWSGHGPLHRIPLSRVIRLNQPEVLEPGVGWKYHDPAREQEFLLREGSWIALIQDPSAPVGLTGHAGGGVFTPDPDALPPLGTPVAIEITFPVAPPPGELATAPIAP